MESSTLAWWTVSHGLFKSNQAISKTSDVAPLRGIVFFNSKLIIKGTLIQTDLSKQGIFPIVFRIWRKNELREKITAWIEMAPLGAYEA